jgi:hypothetical protein
MVLSFIGELTPNVILLCGAASNQLREFLKHPSNQKLYLGMTNAAAVVEDEDDTEDEAGKGKQVQMPAPKPKPKKKKYVWQYFSVIMALTSFSFYRCQWHPTG